MQRIWDRWITMTLGAMFVVLCLLTLSGCTRGDTEEIETELAGAITPSCVLDVSQHPFRDADALPGGRGFLASGNHLGWDLMAEEGLPVYPIGCGVIRLARAANGYGTLAIVVEHRLREPALITNGYGVQTMVSSMLSIYGHLRPTSDRFGQGVSTGLRVGDTVSSETVIGYIEHREDNGDGDEHLHLGIRLQTAVAAQRSDPRGWFRGYDATPSQRGWFTDARAFVLSRAMRNEGRQPSASMDAGVRVHDAGSVFDWPSPVLLDTSTEYSVDAPALPDRFTLDAGLRDQQAVITPRDASTPVFIDASLPAQDVPRVPPRIRYEFRVRSAFRVSPPYRLRDHWWRETLCVNTAITTAEVLSGWARCEAERLELFDGSFFVPDHPDWGDRGEIGTVANTPVRCSAVSGAEWRITDIASGRVLFDGPASGLPCRSVGSQDRLVFPE